MERVSTHFLYDNPNPPKSNPEDFKLFGAEASRFLHKRGNAILEYITLPNNTLPPLGPFPHAVKAGDFLFVTGQLAENPETGELIPGSIEEQVKRVMDNLKLVLEHAGTSFNQVVMARVFITDLRYLETVNKVYSSYFASDRLPSRTTIGVVGLAGLGDVEIDLIVYCGS